jgi:hypothetical protein
MTDDRFDGSLKIFNILNNCYLNYFSYLCKVVLCTLFPCFFSIFWPKSGWGLPFSPRVGVQTLDEGG